MPIPSARSPIEETQTNPNNGDSGICHESQLGYEETRERRIRENRERMQKLGIMDLSLKLKSATPTRSRKAFSLKKNADGGVPASPLPSRRSSRLQNVTPVSYVEDHKARTERKGRKERSYRDMDILLEVGVRPEIYTEEHEKLLGECKMSWELFKDGYGDDGKRVYDSYKGKTCHQCRQKTLGLRTECSQCNMVQGQFCGDCLFMRYGENVLEAKQNPDWLCPVCRGICNCSLCRKAKGWAPTGYLYRKVASLGFKSVAHYLITTQQSLSEKSETDLVAKTPVSAKKSLVFSDKEVNDEDNLGSSQLQSKEAKDDAIKGEDIKIEIEHCSKKKKKRRSSSVQASPDIISGSLRQRRKEEKKHEGKELLVAAFDETVVVEKTLVIIESEACSNKKVSSIATPDSVGARLRKRRMEGKSNEGNEPSVEFNETVVLVKTTSDIVPFESEAACSNTKLSAAATPDSIAGRLRARRNL